MICFNCEMEKACKTRLDLISQKKTYSADFNLLRRKPAKEKYQMLPYQDGEHKPKAKNLEFEPAKDILMKEDYKKFVKRRFERIYNMMECISYMKNEDLPENKEISVYGFTHVKTDEIDNCIRCESDELYEIDKNVQILV